MGQTNKQKKSLGMKPPFSSKYKIQAASLYLKVALFYLCHSLKNLVGPIISLCTEVVGLLSLYLGMIIDFLTMFNMKRHKSPCNQAI